MKPLRFFPSRNHKASIILSLTPTWNTSKLLGYAVEIKTHILQYVKWIQNWAGWSKGQNEITVVGTYWYFMDSNFLICIMGIIFS